MARGAEAVAAFSAEIEGLASERVSTRRSGEQWTLKVRVREARRLTARGFAFSERQLRFGQKTVTLGDDRLQIVQVAVKDNTLSLLIKQARQILAQSEREDEDADALVAEATRLLRQLEEDPLRRVFARRALRGIGHLAADGTVEAIAAAVGAATDTEVVIRALEQPETLSILSASDPLAASRIRGLRERERLLHAEGGTWDAAQVADHLHLTRQGINRRRRAGALLAMDVGRLGYRYPAWQFTRGGTLPGLESTLKGLQQHDAWMQLSFMLSPNPRLEGETPLNALRTGRHEDVHAAAQAFGEHGAA